MAGGDRNRSGPIIHGHQKAQLDDIVVSNNYYE